MAPNTEQVEAHCDSIARRIAVTIQLVGNCAGLLERVQQVPTPFPGDVAVSLALQREFLEEAAAELRVLAAIFGAQLNPAPDSAKS